MRCNYVLPDGVTHTKGFVKDPDEAKTYLSLYGDASNQESSESTRQPELTERLEDQKIIDWTKNVTLMFSPGECVDCLIILII